MVTLETPLIARKRHIRSGSIATHYKCIKIVWMKYILQIKHLTCQMRAILRPMAVDRRPIFPNINGYHRKIIKSIEFQQPNHFKQLKQQIESQSLYNEHHFISLCFRNRVHQWRKIGAQRKYARNNCWFFFNVTSWSCNH